MTQIKRSAGVLVLRAWVEDGTPGGLRARITQFHDVEASQAEVVVASLDQVLAIVRVWVERLLSESQPPPAQSIPPPP
jgi:hypothetical protein